MSIETFDPLNRAFLAAVHDRGQGIALSVPFGYAAMRAFMESPAFIDHLADALHDSDGSYSAIIEFACYCRRIATSDGTKDGPQDDNWSHDGNIYDPAEWGVADPPLCEQTAARVVARMLHR